MEDLHQAGMKPGHVRRMFKALRALEADPRNRPSYLEAEGAKRGLGNTEPALAGRHGSLRLHANHSGQDGFKKCRGEDDSKHKPAGGSGNHKSRRAGQSLVSSPWNPRAVEYAVQDSEVRCCTRRNHEG